MQVRIVQAEKVLFEGAGISVTAPGEEGQFQVLPHHAPYIAVLRAGILTCQSGKTATETTKWNIQSGLLQVADDHVTVFVHAINT